MSDKTELVELLEQAKHLAYRYHALTGRPLGITGEIAEAEAVTLLGLELAPVRSPGYDAIRRLADGTEQRLQVKGRVMHTVKPSGRMSALNVTHSWDAVLLVLLDDTYNTTKIYEASRDVVVRRIDSSESKHRHKLDIAAFCRLGEQIWPPR